MTKIATAILLLISGVAIYGLLSPDMAMFSFLSSGDRPLNPILHPFLRFIRNYYPDLAWCMAAFLIAQYFIEKKFPFLYPALLMVLPFASEWLQLSRLVPGTFDSVDLSLYAVLFLFHFHNKILPMQKIQKHVAGIVAILVLAWAILACGGSKKTYKPLPPAPPPPPKVYYNGTIQLQDRSDEIFTKPSLVQFLQAAKNTAVVLRVPGQVTKVLEEEKYSSNSIYNTIEKEFARAGVIVRDRALFQQVLENTSVDYSKIKELTGTDLILELVGYEKVRYPVNTYKDSAGNNKNIKAGFGVTGIKAEFKIISVKENDFTGSYIFYSVPCTAGCRYVFDETGVTTGATDYFASSESVENFFKDCSLRLLKTLKPN